MAAPNRTKRRYGLPWAGYQSSAAPHLCPPDKATSDGPTSSRRSKNYLYNPLEGKFYRRAGMSQKGSTTGILENGTGELTVARCRQLMSLRSSSLEDGYPTHASLWTEEGNNKGCVGFYNTNGTDVDKVLGDEFSTTTNYPITEDGGVPYSRAWPVLRTTDDTMGRFHSLTLRAISAPGSRRMLEIGGDLHLPNLDGTPWHWRGKTFNDTSADTGDAFRIHHTGRPSPLGLPDINTGTVSTVGPWHDADVFYVSVAYRYADGSVSMPIIPRDPNDDVDYDPGLANMTGFGKVQINSAGTTRYEWIVWSNIPIGPDGVVGRYLLRTPKNDGAVAGGTDPSPLDLRITAYIDNNTETTYNDPNGNDLSLVEDPLLVRFDHIMQPAARYITTIDGRILVGYTKPNPVAIYLAPYVNAKDGDATMDDVIYSYSLTGGTLTLSKTSGAATTTTTITNIGSISLQRLVDKINNTTAGGGGGKWFACIAPGADAAAACDDVLTAADNDNLVSVTGATDFSGDGNGIVRAWGPSWHAPIFFSSTYRANYPTQKRRVFFTMGGPGMPTNAASSFAAGNYRTAPESWGDFMGGAPLPNGAVLCFSKAIGVLQNRKGGNSGVDEDYRLYDLNVGRGCIAWDSICEFNGAVGYLTTDGFVVTDGKDEVVISGDVWNPGSQTGEWAYEIGQCAEAAASDTDIARFHAKVMSGRLFVAYRLHNSGTGRSTAVDAHPNNWMVYDFTGSAQYGGIRGVLKGDGTPWGWSTPQTCALSMGPMCEVVTAAGAVRYVASEDSTGLTSNGLVFKFDDPTVFLDIAADVTAALWTCRDLVDHLKKKAVQDVELLYKKNGTGQTFEAYRDGLGTTADADIALATTSTNNFTRAVLPMPLVARSPADSIEFRLDDTTASSQTAISECWGFEADVLLLDSYL